MKGKVIQIEIMCSEHMKNKFKLRIGDIAGSSEFSNFDKEDILEEISNEIDELREKKPLWAQNVPGRTKVNWEKKEDEK